MAYKIINNHVIIPPNLVPRMTSSRPTRKCQEATVGTEHLLVEPLSRLDNTGKTFFFAVQQIWNRTVTPQQAKAPSVDAFWNHFSKH